MIAKKKKILLPIANMASKDSTRMELDLHCICRINIFVFFAVSFIYFFATLLQKSTAGSIISHESPQFIRLKINMCKEQQCKRMTQKRDFFFLPNKAFIRREALTREGEGQTMEIIRSRCLYTAWYYYKITMGPLKWPLVFKSI